MEKVVNILCWGALIFFAVTFVIIALCIFGLVIYLRSELDQSWNTEEYSEQQRMEDELQIKALKEDAARRAAKKQAKKERRRKRAWKRQNF